MSPFSQANARQLDKHDRGGERPHTSLRILQLFTAARLDRGVQDMTGLLELTSPPSFWGSQHVALRQPRYTVILCDTPCAYASINVVSAT